MEVNRPIGFAGECVGRRHRRRRLLWCLVVAVMLPPSLGTSYVASYLGTNWLAGRGGIQGTTLNVLHATVLKPVDRFAHSGSHMGDRLLKARTSAFINGLLEQQRSLGVPVEKMGFEFIEVSTESDSQQRTPTVVNHRE